MLELLPTVGRAQYILVRKVVPEIVPEMYRQHWNTVPGNAVSANGGLAQAGRPVDDALVAEVLLAAGRAAAGPMILDGFPMNVAQVLRCTTPCTAVLYIWVAITNPVSPTSPRSACTLTNSAV